MFDFGLSEESIAAMANTILMHSLTTKEGHHTHIEITTMFIEIFKKLKEELTSKTDQADE